MAGHFDGGIRVFVEHVGHLAQRLARGGPQTGRVEVKQHFVANRDVQFIVGGAGDVDAVDLPELALLPVHHGADDRAGRGARHTTHHRSALGAVMSAVVSDHCAGDRTGHAAQHRPLLGLRVIVDGLR